MNKKQNLRALVAELHKEEQAKRIKIVKEDKDYTLANIAKAKSLRFEQATYYYEYMLYIEKIYNRKKFYFEKIYTGEKLEDLLETVQELEKQQTAQAIARMLDKNFLAQAAKKVIDERKKSEKNEQEWLENNILKAQNFFRDIAKWHKMCQIYLFRYSPRPEITLADYEIFGLEIEDKFRKNSRY